MLARLCTKEKSPGPTTWFAHRARLSPVIPEKFQLRDYAAFECLESFCDSKEKARPLGGGRGIGWLIFDLCASSWQVTSHEGIRLA